ncbi:hypothetical protein B0J15DRAFT_485977 [Fusarium solani]|uniref:Uncharacterized protein n=1 Tax=Fusarium solani TaxID=169388 RepID=A0A9P9RAM3_FUSSL|nr:uncharacterized protein B0J15DRAFT_485977 [Fusarium solani]KAH7271809.1 hypothetical protein B0J15DRAFT_485977 [Fusarium solani]
MQHSSSHQHEARASHHDRLLGCFLTQHTHINLIAYTRLLYDSQRYALYSLRLFSVHSICFAFTSFFRISQHLSSTTSELCRNDSFIAWCSSLATHLSLLSDHLLTCLVPQPPSSSRKAANLVVGVDFSRNVNRRLHCRDGTQGLLLLDTLNTLDSLLFAISLSIFCFRLPTLICTSFFLNLLASHCPLAYQGKCLYENHGWDMYGWDTSLEN